MAIRSSSGRREMRSMRRWGGSVSGESCFCASGKSSETTVRNLRWAWAVRSCAERALRTKMELNIWPSCGSNRRGLPDGLRGVEWCNKVIRAVAYQVVVFEGERDDRATPRSRRPRAQPDTLLLAALREYFNLTKPGLVSANSDGTARNARTHL